MTLVLRLLLAFAVSATASFAASTEPIESTFQRYWSAFTAKDFAKTTAEILPSDLEDLKKAVLPVFIAGAGTQNKEAQELVNAFFGRTVGKAREAMSPQDVFAALNRVLMLGNPQLFDMLKAANTSIIFVRSLDAENAEIHFQLTLQGESEIEVERLTQKNGRWWMRLKENPAETAEEFKELFARANASPGS